MQYVKSKTSTEVLDYVINWAGELADGETISTSSFTVDTGIFRTIANDSTTATVTLSGGVDGEEYQVENTITTSSGRAHKKTIIVPVLDD